MLIPATNTEPPSQSPPSPSKSSSASPTGQLSFSVDNILSPDFGKPRRFLFNGALSDKNASDESAEKKPTLEPQNAKNGVGGGRRKMVGNQPLAPPVLFPAWVFCTRYSDRPSSGPRCRRIKRKADKPVKSLSTSSSVDADEKRPRTAFTSDQLNRLKSEFQHNRYLTEKRRQELAHELGLNESQIKIWFQNKRAKIKKQTGHRNPLALQLMAQGLYNHATVPIVEADDDDDDGQFTP